MKAIPHSLEAKQQEIEEEANVASIKNDTIKAAIEQMKQNPPDLVKVFF